MRDLGPGRLAPTADGGEVTHPRAKRPAAGQSADAPLALRVESEVERMREALDQLIELSGMSRREVERCLCRDDCGTDLNRLLSGRLDLKVRHVLAICRVIELEPLEFVQIALKPSPAQRSPLLRRLEGLLPYARGEAGQTGATEVAALLRKAEDLRTQLNEVLEREAGGTASRSANKEKEPSGAVRCANRR